MKSPSSASFAAVPVVVARSKAETEFLPAALEILETPSSPVGRAVAGAIILFVCLALGWSILGTVDIVATAQGRIIPTGKSKVIQPFETGVVRAIMVREGQAVKVGDVLIELDPTVDAADEARLAFALVEDRLDIMRLRALLDENLAAFVPAPETDARMVAVARQEMEAQAAEHKAKIDGVDRQIAQKQAEGREIKAAIDKIEASLPLLTEQRDIRAAVLRTQYGSKLLYLQTQQQLVESEHELEGQRQRRDENVESLAALSRQREEIEAGYRKSLLADLAKAEVQMSEHQDDINKSTMKRELRTLRAPVDGVVQQLAVHTLGGVVTSAQQLMVIVPKDAELEIEATLANRDVGFVHKGQDVAVKVETFNFTRYGLLQGRVESVSQDVVASADNATEGREQKKPSLDVADNEQERQAQQPSYVAHISLAAKGVRTEQGIAPLEPGMAVTAEIKTGRRSIIEFLLSPLQRLTSESLRER